MARFTADYLNEKRAAIHANGPVNGFDDAVKLIDAKVHVDQGVLQITTPDGITVPINSEFKAYYNFAIREATSSFFSNLPSLALFMAIFRW